MVSVRVIFLRRFHFFKFSLVYFGGVFNKTIIPLALVGYEMIIANSALGNSRVFIGLAIMVYEPLYHDLQKWGAYA